MHCHSAWRNNDHDLRVDRRVTVDGKIILSDGAALATCVANYICFLMTIESRL